MDEFDRVIFMGSGDYSLAQVGRLYNLLSETLSWISAYQQPDHSDSEEAARQNKIQRSKIRFTINKNANEIYKALGNGNFGKGTINNVG